MLILDLARRSLANRLLTSSLTVGSIALSVGLLIGVEHIRTGVRESFANTVSRTDVIVGTRGGTIQLLLYAVFGMGSPTANMSYETYRHWADHPAVAWTIPYALGDNHRGFRVIGTTDAFYEHYRYRGGQSVAIQEGRRPTGVFDVVLGHEVARALGYEVGERIAVTHGMSATGFLRHDDKPFGAVGILARTFTPVDRAVYLTLEGIEAMHIDWQTGGPPLPGQEVSAAELLAMDSIPITQVTAFLVGAKSRATTLQLQREINVWEGEPLTAVIPGVALAEMWRSIGYAEDGLKVVSAFVVLVGMLGMLVSIYTSLESRRREMAVLRAVGSGPGRIAGLLVLEAGLLASAGALLGMALIYGMLFLLQPMIESRFGLSIPIRPPDALQFGYLGAVVAFGLIMGIVPAIKGYRTTLHDGLAVRV
jgi:putative ABC transport system permease protein